MNKKQTKGWLKHSDFIVLDLVCMQFSFCLAYWLLHGWSNPYLGIPFRNHAFVLIISQLLVTLFGNNHSGILRRKRFDEAVAVIKYILGVAAIILFYYFAVQVTGYVSRLHTSLTFVIFLILDLVARHLNKMRLLKGNRSEKRSILLITGKRLVKDLLENLISKDIYQDFQIPAVVLLDAEPGEELPDYHVSKEGTVMPIPHRKDRTRSENIILAAPMSPYVLERIGHGWIDEAFLFQPDDLLFPSGPMTELVRMGIPVNYTMSWLNDDRWPITDMRKIGRYKVLSTSIRFASSSGLLMKRLMDIAGGIIGCVLTGIIALFIGPLIYLKSPGPIFFAQDRVGQNGKVFKMYKFRSMYPDAEEHKAALMEQNKITDGMMFKIEDDPRIIGSEKKDKNGKPKGIGNFIRNTSLDEFPQFCNVLKGDMSLVGTRPPTLDEWKKYDLEHRIRMSTKPGITGLWQVSGRSQITDFDEVVRLDREYIENWSILKDIKILIKTVFVVAKRKGAE